MDSPPLPNIPNDDPEARAAYQAEEVWLGDLAYWTAGAIDPDEDGFRLTPAQVETFIERCLAGAGFYAPVLPGGAVVTGPRLFFDGDETDWAGWHSGATGDLHFAPRILNKHKVIHELAHWLRPRDGHGPEWAGVMVALVKAAFGEDAGAALMSAFEDNEVLVDESWLE